MDCPIIKENEELKEENETLKKALVELREQVRDMIATAKRKE